MVMRLFLRALCLALALRWCAIAASNPPPNVVFILADDLGWSDTTLYGATRFYETPHLERLAARGMLFRNAYAANPLCSPTRASILTGLYPGRLGLTAPVAHLPEARLSASLVPNAPATAKALQAVSATRLDTNCVTLAERFKSAGYATAHFGKWHLGPEPFSPLEQGFDRDVPHTPAPGPGGGYLAPWRFLERQRFEGKPGEHIEDRLAAEAARFIREHKSQPFFLNYWAFSVHSPWTAKPELIEKYRKKANALPPHAPHRNPIYGAMVQSLDEAVGRLLDALDESQLSERTIVVFSSDNGGWCWTARAEGSSQEATTPITSNAPWRGGKATLYEGGTRVPCVVVWPGRIKPGSTSDAFLSSVDFYATLLEMAGLKPPGTRRLDGISQVPALLGQGHPRQNLFCYFPHYIPATGNLPGVWVRAGEWKLIRFFCDKDDQSHRHELYNLRLDPGETNNLAMELPRKVTELSRLIDQHLRDIGALIPRPNPGYVRGVPSLPPGWSLSKDLTQSVGTNTLILRSTGSDPFIVMADVPPHRGPLTISIRMKSDSRGRGQFFWSSTARPTFNRTNSVIFDVRHNNLWVDYEMTLPVREPVRHFRLDPSQASGTVEIERISVVSPSGDPVKVWDFRSPGVKQAP